MRAMCFTDNPCRTLEISKTQCGDAGDVLHRHPCRTLEISQPVW
jgi:hypothetical protein